MRVLLIVVSAVISTACATSGATPRPFPAPRGSAPATVPDARAVSAGALAGGYEISGTALSLRGTPYRNGGADTSGFDCSGFVWYVFGQHGVPLPRTVGEQAQSGREIDAADVEPGDLVFFTTTSPGASHVGIVIGGDSFVHAPSSSGVVRVERLSASYWSSRFVGARRVL